MKLTSDELGNKLDLARSKFPIHSIWQHYKGGSYEVTGHTILTDENLTTLVTYRRVNGPDYDPITERGITFGRPIQEWSEIVKKDRVHLARFRCVV